MRRGAFAAAPHCEIAHTPRQTDPPDPTRALAEAVKAVDAVIPHLGHAEQGRGRSVA